MSCTTDSCGIGGWGGPKPGDPDNNSVLTATPAFGGIDITWTYPLTNPQALAYTILYRSILPEFNESLKYATVAGGFFYDKVDVNQRFYYWIEFVSVNGTHGEPIGPATALARPKIEDLIEQMTGRIDAGVLATSLKTEIAKIQTNDNNILLEIQERINSNAALATVLANVQAGVDDAMTFVANEITQRTEGDAALVTSLNAIAAITTNAAAAIQTEQQVRADADTAMATQISTNYTQLGNAITAAVQAETTSRVAADAVLAGQITTAQSTLNGNIAAAQTTLQTNINTVNGKVTEIGALYTAKVSVNGLIGGFGVYNDGTVVQAGFDVDEFWIGRTQLNKRKPFIIVGSETFIDEAVINKLTFSKLRSADGSLIVEDGKIKVTYLDADSIIAKNINISPGYAGAPRTVMTNGLTQVFDGANVLRVRMGVW